MKILCILSGFYVKKKWNFFKTALKLFLEGIFRCDFFKTASTHRDTSIAHVFHDFGPPVTPIPHIEHWKTAYLVRISVYFLCKIQRTSLLILLSPGVRQGVWGSQVVQNHEKHAQSTYLDEYLRFKKNHPEKFLLDFFTAF